MGIKCGKNEGRWGSLGGGLGGEGEGVGAVFVLFEADEGAISGGVI